MNAYRLGEITGSVVVSIALVLIAVIGTGLLLRLNFWLFAGAFGVALGWCLILCVVIFMICFLVNYWMN